MGNGSSLVFSGIAPHPPIMVPEVGREAISEVRRSIAAMRELTRQPGLRLIDWDKGFASVLLFGSSGRRYRFGQ